LYITDEDVGQVQGTSGRPPLAKKASISVLLLNPSEFPWESGELADGLFGEVGGLAVWGMSRKEYGI
jgi:hypothetical protein